MGKFRETLSRVGSPRNKRRFAIGVLAILLASVLLQLAYPRDRPVPGQSIGDYSVGLQSPDTLTKQLRDREKAQNITLVTKQKQRTVSYSQIGIKIDSAETLKAAADYPWWQRIIPLSSAYRAAFANTPLQTTANEAKVQSFAAKLSETDSKKATDASLSIKDGKVVRQRQIEGFAYTQATVTKQLTQNTPQPGELLVLKASTLKPRYDQAALEPTAKKAEAILATKFTITVQGTQHTVPANDIGNWLVFQPDAAGVTIAVDKDKVKAFVAERGKSAYKAPGTTTITLRDGREIQRSEEKQGQAVDDALGAEKLAEALPKATRATVEIPLRALPPNYIYNRSYTKSSLGMQAMLTDLASAEPNMSIAVRALDGSGITASYKGSKTYDPASTYKLVAAYEAYKRIEAGTLQPGTPVNGRTVDQCIAAMIVTSDNPCAKALGSLLGWQALTNSARSIGMANTNLSSSNNFTSTADDQATFMTKLQLGELINPTHRNQLLGLLKQQTYRQGVPKGAAGSEVANKPGFIGGLLHDSAIVYGPKGPYVIVIYSSGSSWSDLATISGKVHQLMNQ